MSTSGLQVHAQERLQDVREEGREQAQQHHGRAVPQTCRCIASNVPMCRSAFKTYVKKIVNRRNSITGVLYRDDPTIMAWDLANEPYVLGDASGEVLKARRSVQLDA